MKKLITWMVLICMVTGLLAISTPVVNAAGETPPADGLQVWLKSDSGITADNGLVSKWANQAGSGLDGIQATDASMPLVITDKMNNKPVLRFGVRDTKAAFMNLSGFDSIDMSSYSVAFMIKPIELMNWNEAIFANSSTGEQEFTFHSEASGGLYAGVAIQDEQRLNNWDLSTTGALMNKRWDRVYFTYDKTTETGTLYVNGVLKKSGSMRVPNSWSTLAIGFDDAKYGLNADLAELMVYNRALSDDEVSTIDAYLTNKFPERGPEPDPIPEAPNLPVFCPLTTLYSDTFEDAQGNNALSYWDTSSSTTGIEEESGNKVLQLSLKDGSDWPEASRYLYDSMSGKVVLKYKLKMEDLSAFKVLPRFISSDGTWLGQVFFDQSNPDNKKLVVIGKDNTSVDIAGGTNIQANQWYDISVEINTDSKQITAWVGSTEPQQKNYVDFMNPVNNVSGMKFILTGVDTYGPKEAGSIFLDDVTVMAPATASTLPMENAYTEDFQGTAVDGIPDGWQAESSVSKVVDDSGNKAMKLQVKENVDWPDLKKSLPIPLSGGITLKLKLKLENLETFKTLPRLFGGDNELIIGDILYDHIKNDIEVVGKQKFCVSGDAGSNIKANEWFDLTIQMDTENHVMTAWIGVEPQIKKYVQFQNNVNDFQIMDFILDNIELGPFEDGFYGIPEKGGVLIDDISVSYIDKPGALLEGSTLPEFSDINGIPAENDIMYLAMKGILTASDDSTFRPSESISVNDFIKWIVQSKGFSSESNYVQKATDLGLVIDGEFTDYSRPITRGEMLRIAVRAVKEQSPAILDRYIAQIKDYFTIGGEFRDFAAKAFAIGIVDGTKEFNIRAGDNATRAEAATATARVLDINRRIPAIAVQRDLFVDPESGNDQNSGTSSRPFKTIEKARDFVRTINGNMNGDIIVWLKGGNYSLSNTLTLGSSDSGTNGFNIVYMAYPDQTPIVSGGKKISNWTLYKDGIYKADAKGLDFRQLYVNGKRAVRARTPNKENDDNFGPYNRVVGWDTDNKRIIVQKDQISNWSGLQNVEMIVKKHWDQSIFRIDSFEINGDNAYITPKEPERTLEFDYCIEPFKMPDDTYYFENSLDFLDSEGEWFLDKDTNTVYYKPRSGEDINNIDVVAPAVDLLVDFNGASHVNFVNTVFEHSRYVLGDSGRVGLQSGSQFTGKALWDVNFIPGGVRLINTDHITLQGDTFRNMGGTGIELAHGTHDNIINGCTIKDIGNSGILVYNNVDNTNAKNNNPPDADKCMNDRITNNFITRVGQDFTGSSGICVTYGTGTVIEHNEVCYTPYNGISVGFGWTSETTALRDNVIQYNNVHHVMQLHDDSAGIYTLSKQPGTVIYDNWCHDIEKSEWAEYNQIAGIYLDNQSEGITLNRNVIENVPKNIHLNTQTTNYFINNRMILQWVKDFAGPKGYLVSKAYPKPSADIVPPATQNSNTSTETASNVTEPLVGSDGSVRLEVKPELDNKTQTAACQISKEELDNMVNLAKENSSGEKVISLDVQEVVGAKAYQQEFPQSLLSSKAADLKVEINTPIGNVIVPSNMFASNTITTPGNIGISIGIADMHLTDEKMKEAIGNKPVIELNAKVDGKTVEWNNPGTPVTVSINYKPSEAEKKDLEHIVVWYINSKGEAVSVPNGRYNVKTGKVSFTTSHFSTYAVAYVNKSFPDVSEKFWGRNAIEVLASKGIVEGTSESIFSPNQSATRGEFIKYLVKTLGLTADFETNFSDVKNTDAYYNEIGIAKALNITQGTGKNNFSPKSAISRQDMMVLTVRAIKAAGINLEAGSLNETSKYTDKALISQYAVQDVSTMIRAGFVVGNGTRLNPKASTTRAEVAQILYNIYNKLQ